MSVHIYPMQTCYSTQLQAQWYPLWQDTESQIGQIFSLCHHSVFLCRHWSTSIRPVLYLLTQNVPHNRCDWILSSAVPRNIMVFRSSSTFFLRSSLVFSCDLSPPRAPKNWSIVAFVKVQHARTAPFICSFFFLIQSKNHTSCHFRQIQTFPGQLDRRWLLVVITLCQI